MQVGKYQTIIVETSENITKITLNRPEKKNAMSPEMHSEMFDALSKLEEDEETRVLVLTGAGNSFCAGQDLKKSFLETVDTPKRRRGVSRVSQNWGKKLRTFPRPTIAQVNGWCFGGGMRVMCICDFAIASEKAVFGLSEINFAHFPGAGTTWAHVYHIHPRDYVYLAMTGETIDAREAERMRLINKAVPHEELETEVMKLATKLREKDPIALMECKEALRLSRRLDYDDAVAWEVAKSEELGYLHEGLWVKALKSFEQKEFKPGLGSYGTKAKKD
jgi:feruloyl-CoA hydratase/lyase